MGLKGAIFDLDGVITNSVPLHFKAWEKMFAEYGIDFTFEDYQQKVDGRPRIEGAKAILTDLSEEEIIKASDKKQKYFREFLDQEPIEVFESSVKILKEMKNKNIKLAAASSSKNANYILKKIKLYDMFEAHVSGADFKRGKPDPEIFITAAKQLKLKPENCVVFEDAKAGVEAALNGHFFCVGINRHNSENSLNGADIIVKDLSETSFEEIIKKMENKKWQ